MTSRLHSSRPETYREEEQPLPPLGEWSSPDSLPAFPSRQPALFGVVVMRFTRESGVTSAPPARLYASCDTTLPQRYPLTPSTLASLPLRRRSVLSIGKSSSERNSSERDSPQTPARPTEVLQPKRSILGSVSSKAKLSFDHATAMSMAGSREASADDLAPCTAEAEDGGKATQGDFLMHARARRQAMMKHRSSSEENINFSAGLDDTQISSPTAHDGARVRPRQLMSSTPSAADSEKSPLPSRPRAELR